MTDGIVSEKSESVRLQRVGPVPLVNPANALTAARIVLVPVFVLLTVASGLTHPGLRMAACVAFFVAAVTDLVDGMMFLREQSGAKVDAFNIGPLDDGITVRRIAEEVVTAVAPGAQLRFQSDRKGWVGDVPRFRYSTAKLQRLGWTPKLDSSGAIRRAVAEIADQVFCAVSASSLRFHEFS